MPASGLWRALWLLVGMVALAGCTREPSASQSSPASDNGQSAKASVPLRVWFTGAEASQAIIQRQWQATSERPLELRMLTGDDLLKAENCPSDVVVYPAHLIGDLIARGWLVELPSTLVPSSLSSGGSSSSQSQSNQRTDEAAPPLGQATGDATTNAAALAGEAGGSSFQPAAWIDQARYGRTVWGLSLGATAPVILTNFELTLPAADSNEQPTSEEAKAAWQAVVKALSDRTSGKQNDHAALVDADPDAVCDRFLVVLTSINPRESRFGTLLDPETLKARLAEPVFIDAAEILLQLHKLNAAPQAMAGSHQAAWEAISGDQPVVGIGVPPLPTPDVDKATSIAINLPPTSPTSTSARGTTSERTVGWNSGHGLIASLTTQCRQTSLAIEFMRWLESESTRNALVRSVDGVSAQTVYAPGSSAWQAQRLGQRVLQQPRLPNQPRLPGSAEYRRALGQQLVRMLHGQQGPEAALKAAAAAWDEITGKRTQSELRASYEASLGL